jgi:hypothetical protein
LRARTRTPADDETCRPKVKGHPLAQIDASYVQWVRSDRCERATPALRAAVEAELARRRAQSQSPLPLSTSTRTAVPASVIDDELVITTGPRVLATQFAGDVRRRDELDQVMARLRSLAATAGLVEAPDDGESPF